MADYIPSGDADFNTWQQNFLTTLNGAPAAFGLTAADIAPLTDKQTTWTQAYNANSTAQASAKAASQAKEAARDDYEKALRSIARRVQSNNQVTNEQRALLNLTVPTGARTPTGAPTTRPVPQVDTSQRLRHAVSFADEATPSSRARPDGVMGCEIWVKVGDPAPVDATQLQFLGLDTSTPYVATYGGDAAGKTAYYMLRWVNSKGEYGPWSQTVSATITG
ncbi:MAG: hypothetical protein LC731_08645 [Acidobacteria bacterium]|nr:hypothetical protein [Acidobacteriota bacterium]